MLMNMKKRLGLARAGTVNSGGADVYGKAQSRRSFMNYLAMRSFAVVAALLASGGAQAADRFWDGGTVDIAADGNGASAGGAGTWNTTIKNWDAGASAHVAWVNGSNDIAIFGGSGATVTLGTGITVGGLTLTATYTVTGNTLTFGAAGSISNTANVTISSILAGSGPITKDGNGTLTLSGINTYTGGTVLNGGVLAFTYDEPLGDPAGAVTLNGAQLSVGNKVWTSTRPLILNAGTNIIRTAGNGNWDCAGPVSGTGGVLIRSIPNGGNGQSFSSVSNTFTGELGIDSSGQTLTMRLGSLADSPGAGNIYWLPSGNTSALQWLATATNPLVLNNRQIEFRGDGTLSQMSLQNYNTSHAIIINTDLLVSGSGNKTFNFNAVNSAVTNEIAGSITDGTSGATVALTKTGNGALVLSGTNTYSGATTVSAGTLIIGSVDALSNTASLSLPSATAKNLTMNVNATVAKLFIAGVQQPNGVYTAATNASGWMNGSGSLTVGSSEAQPVWWDSDGGTPGAGGATPTGTWGVNSYWSSSAAGDVATAAWTAGRTAAFAAGTDAAGAYTVTVDGTQDIGGLTFEEGTVTLSGGTALRMVSDSVAYVASVSQTATVATVISEDASSRSLVKGGTGALVLSSANSYTGPTTVSAGTLKLAHADAIASSSGLVLSGGTLAHDIGVNISNLTINKDYTTISGTNTLNFAPGGVITINSAVGGNWVNVATIKSAITGTPAVVLNTGDNIETVFAPESGTVSLGAVSGGGLIELGGSTTGNTVASTVNKIRVTGGEWTLLGSGYDYQHFINYGTLIVAPGGVLTASNAKGINLSDTATLVANGTVGNNTDKGINFTGSVEDLSPNNIARPGGTLKGTGVVNQNFTLDVVSQATLAPGYPTGTLTITNCGCTIAGTLAITVNGDQVSTLAVDPAKTLTITSATLEVNVLASPLNPVVIATYGAGKLVGPAFAANNLPSGWTIDYQANGGTAITLTAPPSGTLIQFM
jgi:autotransporter-associated beta strand protein